MTDQLLSLAVTPIIKYPREAQVGKTYLMTIDLQPEEGLEWQYEEEEYPVYCKVDSEIFSSKPIGEPVVVLHRFGGNYGEARFLLTAALEAGQGEISVILINAWGVPFKVVKLEQIQLLPTEIIHSETDFFAESRIRGQQAAQYQTVEDYFLMVLFRSSRQQKNSYYVTAYLLPDTSRHEEAGIYNSVIRLERISK